MRYDDELKRKVPSSLGELRQYFDDADPVTLGGDIEKANILSTIDLLIDAAPAKARAEPQMTFTNLVRMILSKAKEMATAVHQEATQMSDLQVLIEGAKRTNNPVKMIAVAKRIEQAAASPAVNAVRAAQVRALATALRAHASKVMG